jgi:hypothetical protein
VLYRCATTPISNDIIDFIQLCLKYIFFFYSSKLHL